MTKWDSPATVAKDEEIALKIVYVFVGVYLWEYVASLDFDHKFLRGLRRFQWPMIFYFGARYLALGLVIALLVAANPHSPLNCHVLLGFIAFSSAVSVACSCTLLGIRAMSVWGNDRRVVVILCTFMLTQYALAISLVTTLDVGDYVPGAGCIPHITVTTHRLVAATVIFTMVFDTLLTVLVLYKLKTTYHASAMKGRLPMINLMFHDGIIYFISALSGNIVVAVLFMSNLNTALSGLATTPAVFISTIAATRLVRRLTAFVEHLAAPSEEIKPPMPGRVARMNKHLRPTSTMFTDLVSARRDPPCQDSDVEAGKGAPRDNSHRLTIATLDFDADPAEASGDEASVRRAGSEASSSTY